MPKNPKNVKKIIAIVAVVIVLVVVIAIFFSPNFGNFSIPNNTVKSLEIIANINNSSIVSGSNISLQIELYNTGQTIRVKAGNIWPELGGVTQPLGIGVCPSYLPFGFALLQGYITANSHFSGKPLAVWRPGIYMCPFYVKPSSYEIFGHSDIALTNNGGMPANMTLEDFVNISGYWVEPNPSNGTYIFVNFPTGEYTIVVADEWGAVELLHFKVT